MVCSDTRDSVLQHWTVDSGFKEFVLEIFLFLKDFCFERFFSIVNFFFIGSHCLTGWQKEEGGKEEGW